MMRKPDKGGSEYTYTTPLGYKVFNKEVKGISQGVGVGFTPHITYSLKDLAVIYLNQAVR
jgi:hypothetical protein